MVLGVNFFEFLKLSFFCFVVAIFALVHDVEAIFHLPYVIIIIISIFKEDNVFSITASFPYGPPVNTDIDYYRTFFRLVYFCNCCEVSCAIFC